MNKAIKFLSIFTFLLFGCNMNSQQDKTPDYVNHVNELVKSFSKAMKKEYGLVCIGSGGRMPHDIEEICIKFIAYQHATIEEARQLEVTLTEKFLAAINSNEKLGISLNERPFTVKRAEVSVTFYKPNNSPYTDGSVAYVTQFNNTISYYEEPEPNVRLILLKEEPYSEALKIVNESSK